jgi:hypothetical protein
MITSGFKIPFRPIVGRLCQTPPCGASIGVSQKRPTNRFLKPLDRGVIPPIFDELSEAIPGIILKAA